MSIKDNEIADSMEADFNYLLDAIEPLESRNSQSPYTNFARKETVRKSNGKIYANFATSFSGSCTAPFAKYIIADSLIKVTNVGNCPNGKPVLKFEHY